MNKRQERIKRFRNNAEVQRKLGDLQGCLEFRELAEELEKLEKIEQIIKRTEGTLGLDNYTVQQIKEVLENE